MGERILLIHSVEVNAFIFETRVFLDGERVAETPGHFAKEAEPFANSVTEVARRLGADVRYRDDQWSEKKRRKALMAEAERIRLEEEAKAHA